MTVGSLFAGIGGFDLAAERVGWHVKWQVEIDPFCQQVLEKHWPHVRRYGDIRERHDYEPVDVLCGGFPCQDISVAGNGAGITGERSGLWTEYLRLIGELRPRYVVVENVAALLGRGMGVVLGGLAASGYDAEWDCVPASAVGADHQRDRVWIVAYAARDGRQSRREGDAAEITRGRQSGRGGVSPNEVGDSDGQRQLQPQGFVFDERRRPSHASWWAAEPNVGRVAHGVPRRVDRLRGLGNSIVPQVAEWIFRQIQACDAMTTDRPR